MPKGLRKRRWRATITAEFESYDYPGVSEEATAARQADYVKRGAQRAEGDVNCSRVTVKLAGVVPLDRASAKARRDADVMAVAMQLDPEMFDDRNDGAHPDARAARLHAAEQALDHARHIIAALDRSRRRGGS